MTELIIFDLDGTLLNTIDDLAASTNFALNKHGYPTHDLASYRFFVGNGINKLIERALPEAVRSESEVLKLREDFIAYYEEHSADLTKPYKGIPELLSLLKEKGLKMAVASNKYQAATEYLVDKYFSEYAFDVVLGQRDGITPKPDPTIVYDILKETGMEKSKTIYVGDSGVDMQTANAAELTSVGVSWGFRPVAELEQYTPSYLVDQPIEIYQIIQSENK
ncbi:MAG: HAD family hydrolase [Bacteroidales bacterium]